MMNIEFEKDEKKFKEMQKEWNDIPDALFMTHYELSAITSFDALSWRKFLTHPAVVDYFNEEMAVIQQTKLRTLINEADVNSKSTGLPQLINAIAGQLDRQTIHKEGPVFIYTYVPLNEQEKQAQNVRFEDADIIADITKE